METDSWKYFEMSVYKTLGVDKLTRSNSKVVLKRDFWKFWGFWKSYAREEETACKTLILKSKKVPVLNAFWTGPGQFFHSWKKGVDRISRPKLHETGWGVFMDFWFCANSP